MELDHHTQRAASQLGSLNLPRPTSRFRPVRRSDGKQWPCDQQLQRIMMAGLRVRADSKQPGVLWEPGRNRVLLGGADRAYSCQQRPRISESCLRGPCLVGPEGTRVLPMAIRLALQQPATLKRDPSGHYLVEP